MRILIAPDSYKECLDAKLVTEYIEEGIIESNYSKKELQIKKLPLCDGGEGFLERIIESNNGFYISSTSINPLGNEITAKYGVINNDTVIIESAKVCGLDLISKEIRDPKLTTSYGLGTLVNDALSKGYRKITVGLGGSATNDGGAGFLQALGVSLRDINNDELPFGGYNLLNLKKIDLSTINKLVFDAKFTLVCNPTSILCGENGTSRIYSFQKGGTKKDAIILERALNNYADNIKKLIGKEIRYSLGSGGAGGIGSVFISFLNTELIPSMNYVQRTLNLEEHIKNSDLIITGEGKLDGQTPRGKVVDRVCKISKKYNKPVIVLVGQATSEADLMYSHGMSSYYCIGNSPRTLEDALNNIEFDLKNSSKRLFELLSIGGNLSYGFK